MKKVLFIFALILGITFNMKAQDTLNLANQQISFENQSASASIDTTFNYATIYFTVENLGSRTLSVTYNGEEYSTTIEEHMVINPIYSDSIISIDTVQGAHPGLYEYDTTYMLIGYDTTYVQDTVNLFSDGSNYFTLPCWDSVFVWTVVMDSIDMDTIFINEVYIVYEGNLDIVEITSNMNFSIYPNPVSNIMTISGGEVRSVKVYDIFGKLLKSFKNDNMVNLVELKKGTYFVIINDSVTKKIVKY